MFKKRSKMKRLWILANLIFFLSGLPAGVMAEVRDIFLKKKSDSAIKPLVFPKSMHVIESRPEKNLYYFYEGDEKKFVDQILDGGMAGGASFASAMSDPKVIQKTLVALDRARINPAAHGDDVRGVLTRKKLKEIANKASKEMVLVFRREIHVLSDLPAPKTVFQNPDELFDFKRSGNYSLRIRDLGIVFLAKQNKILIVPSNEKLKSIFEEGESLTREQVIARVQQFSREGLEELAASARKIIKDNEFVVRRSAY